MKISTASLQYFLYCSFLSLEEENFTNLLTVHLNTAEFKYCSQKSIYLNNYKILILSARIVISLHEKSLEFEFELIFTQRDMRQKDRQ